MLGGLPAGCPAPALVGARRLPAGEAEHPWQLLVTEAVDGRVPQPWTAADVAAAHDASVLVGELLEPLAARYQIDFLLRRALADAGRLPRDLRPSRPPGRPADETPGPDR